MESEGWAARGCVFLPGHHLALLRSGAEYFPALIAAIGAARHAIYLQTYIYADDAMAAQITAALCDAARRGVTVRLMVDGFGGGDFATRTQPQLVAAGVEVLIFRPERRWGLPSRFRLRRLHRKLCVVDEAIALIGGINLIDDFNTPQPMGPRFDFAATLRGPVVASIQASMNRLWQVVSLTQKRKRARFPAKQTNPIASAGDQTVAFLLRDNLRNRRSIERAYLAALAQAKEEIILANAYFLPGRRFTRAILDAAQRGVRVCLLLQGRIEYGFQHYATQSYYDRLLAAGVEIHEYQDSFLHAKVAVVDKRWATLGSSNIDPFSLMLAREANVAVLDAGFASALHDALREAITLRAKPVAQSDRTGLTQRALRRICYWGLRAAIAYIRPAENFK